MTAAENGEQAFYSQYTESPSPYRRAFRCDTTDFFDVRERHEPDT